MVKRTPVTIVAALALATAWGVPAASAQEATEAVPADAGWSFALTPYAWFIAMKGDVATFSGAPPINVDADFSDIIDQTNGAALLAGEARRDRFGLLFDINYLDLSGKGDTPGALFGDAEMDNRTLFSDIAGFYEVGRDALFSLDVYAGARLWYVETEVNLRAGLLPNRTDQDSEAWADPIVGVRGQALLGRGFSLQGAADYGGFHVGSKNTWQVIGTLGYDFNDRLSARAGYRYLSVDYDDNGFVWDVDIHGPIIGLTWRF
ncbi:MAG: hypothetical protein H6852_12060 [Geminicoccaceae bacterium]|nr:hypothetical protein [Geminicoccaceae bacterium]HRY24944.1 hypothetical protein [Geminicoccaceae bacterium]